VAVGLGDVSTVVTVAVGLGDVSTVVTVAVGDVSTVVTVAVGDVSTVVTVAVGDVSTVVTVAVGLGDVVGIVAEPIVMVPGTTVAGIWDPSSVSNIFSVICRSVVPVASPLTCTVPRSTLVAPGLT
jgi:hypothetical protein